MQLLRDLQARGVSRETAQEALSLEGEADETELVRRWIEKKIPDPEEAGRKRTSQDYTSFSCAGDSSPRIYAGRWKEPGWPCESDKRNCSPKAISNGFLQLWFSRAKL